MYAVELPNGLTMKYFETYDEALQWTETVDPEGMIDYNIREV